jgi:hypothetical protein
MQLPVFNIACSSEIMMGAFNNSCHYAAGRTDNFTAIFLDSTLALCDCVHMMEQVVFSVGLSSQCKIQTIMRTTSRDKLLPRDRVTREA